MSTIKPVILIAVFLMGISQLYAQSSSAPIEVKKSLGVVFQQNGRNLTPRQLLSLTGKSDEAYREMKIARSNYSAASVFGFAGGFMVGWPIGAAIGGGDPSWAMAGIGAGLIAIAIPFNSAYSKHAQKAVVIYNEGLKQSNKDQIDFELGLTCSGIGLRITF